MNTPALENLHDFAQPALPSLIPQTAAWYVLFGLMAVLFAWWTIRQIRSWMANRYRRSALAQLEHTSDQELSALLKRTALAVWPRNQIASLTGNAWLRFLNNNCKEAYFESDPGRLIEELAVRGTALPSADSAELRKRVEKWIKGHHVSA